MKEKTEGPKNETGEERGKCEEKKSFRREE
jgi:hypothetical protein